MSRYLENRQQMADNVVDHFDDHPAAWQDEEAVASAVEPLRAATARMRGADETQDRSSRSAKGITQTKRKQRATLTDGLHRLGLKATTYALRAGDDELRQTLDHSKSDWNRMNEADFLAASNTALDQAEQRLDVLATDTYKVSADEIAELRRLRTEYGGKSSTRAGTSAEGTRATAERERIYSEQVLPELQILDRAVPAYITDGAFVAEYVILRRIPGE